MNNNRPFRILDDIAKDYIPDQTNLVPRLAAQLERKTLMKMIHTRPLVAVIVTLLILLVLSGAAYALGKSRGYIPGVGIVNDEVPLRVLAEPVVLKKDGVTVTVENAILSSDKTSIQFILDGIPVDTVEQDITQCKPWGGVKLPDGLMLQTIGGHGLSDQDLGTMMGFRARYVFEPVPGDVNEVTFIPPCLQHYLPGALSEDWGVTLHFVPAPADMAIVPVQEVIPPPDAVDENMILEKVIETENGYILVGKFASNDLPPNAKAVNLWGAPGVQILDANGDEVSYTLPNNDLGLPYEDVEEGAFLWAFELEGKSFAWPLTITVETIGVEYGDVQSPFEFDTGPTSEDGQLWEPNLDLEIAGHPVQLIRVFRLSNSYQFEFKSVDSAVFQSVDVTVGDSIQGLKGNDGPYSFLSEAIFEGEVPTGTLTVLVTNPVIQLEGLWQVQWQPDNLTAPTQSP